MCKYFVVTPLVLKVYLTLVITFLVDLLLS